MMRNVRKTLFTDYSLHTPLRRPVGAASDQQLSQFGILFPPEAAKQKPIHKAKNIDI